MALRCPQQGVPVVCVLGWGEMGAELALSLLQGGIPCSLAAVLTRALSPHCPPWGCQWHQEPGVSQETLPGVQRDEGTEPWHSRFLWNSLQQGWQENMENSRSEPLMHRWICSASAGQPHHTQRLNQAWPCLPAPAQTSKDRAEGIFSQKEYQDLILLGGGKAHQTQSSSLCLEIQGWQGAADGATSVWSRRAAGG